MIWLGLKRGRHSLVALIGVAMLCAVSVSVPAQPVFQYQETMKDVDPGVDHGNSDAAVPDEYKKQRVFYRSQQPPGTIIIDTSERHLYLIQNETYAIRYGIGVGRDGFTWQGLLQISRKAEWPDWHPPPEMIARQPYLPRHVSRQHRLPHPRHQRARDHRAGGIVRLLPSGQRRRGRSLRPGECRHQSHRAAELNRRNFPRPLRERRNYCALWAAAATDCAVWPNKIARSSAVRMPPWPGLIFGAHA
jgi:hypothetical protein